MLRDEDLSGLAMTLARDTDMQISIGGKSSYCSADGKHINIARMPATHLGKTLMSGLVFHEVAHKLYTNGVKAPGLLGELTNVLEDIRVEALSIKERPGTAYDLEAVTHHYAKNGNLTPNDLCEAFLGLIMAHGRAQLLGQQALDRVKEKGVEILSRSLGSEFPLRVQEILERKLVQLNSTADAQNLAQQLLDLLRAHKNREKEKEEQKNTRDNSSEPEGAQGSAPNAQQSTEKIQADNSNSSTTGENISSTGKNVSAASSADKTPASKRDGSRSSSTLTEQIDKMIANGSDGYADVSRIITRELDQLSLLEGEDSRQAVPLLPRIGHHRPSSKSTMDESRILSGCSQMRARLLTLLHARRNQPEARASTGKRLATNRLVRLGLNDPRIFKRRREHKRVDTAIMILLDTSGSMAKAAGQKRRRCDIANEAAFAMHHTLYALGGVKVCSAYFYQSFDTHSGVNIITDFDARPESRMFKIKPQGLTPIGAGLWYARAALLKRREARKIILLLTDGYPSEPQECTAASTSCLRSGIEIAAIGIETNSVSNYWKQHQIIQDVSQLPQAVFKVIEDLNPGCAEKGNRACS